MTELQEDTYVHEMLTCVEMYVPGSITDRLIPEFQSRIVVFVLI